jgi:hypothetical protein
VCEQLLYKVLYSSNSEGLEELDSEYDGPTTSSSGTNMLEDADEDHSSSAKYAGTLCAPLYMLSLCALSVCSQHCPMYHSKTLLIALQDCM